MDLYPQDLGEQISRQVQQDRSSASVQPEAAGLRPSGPGMISVSLAVGASLLLLGGAIAIAGVLGLGALLCFGVSLYRLIRSPKLRQRVPLPLSKYEVQAVRQQAGDALLQHYLDLALSVINLPDIKDETANREVRDAITALATAVEALPPDQIVVSDDPPALRAEAQTQIENAQGETDPVIAASLRRRAESLLRRADTAAKTLLLLRRNRALRDEVNEQIKALRTSLTALQIGGRQSAPQLSGLAASIHRVALEANAVTVARAEVDTLLSQPVRSVEEPQAVRIRM